MNPRGFVVGDRILGQTADSHADWCAAYGEWGGYRFIGASAIGKLHLRENRPRDDAFAMACHLRSERQLGRPNAGGCPTPLVNGGGEHP